MKKLINFLLDLIRKILNKNNTQETVDPPVINPKEDETKYPDWAEEMLKLHNELRSSNLIIDDSLMSSAQEWANNMARKRKMYHGSLNFPGFRLRGENIAMGSNSVNQIFNMWKKSSGHRANIQNKNFTHVGFGMQQSNGYYYWCAQFGSR